MLIGNYTLRVQNDVGEKEFTYNVIVYLPPLLKNAAYRQTVVHAVEAAQLTSNCDVDAIPKPEVCHLF